MVTPVTGPLRIGVDFAKTTDYTAISVTEQLLGKPETQPEYDVRVLQRLPHQTKYRTVAKYLAQLVKNLQADVLQRLLGSFLLHAESDEERAVLQRLLRQDGDQRIQTLVAYAERHSLLHEIQIVADATGVGMAVVELVEEETEALPCQVIGATFRFGDMLDWSTPGALTVGKARLVRTLKILLQEGRLHLPPDDPVAPLAADEIRNYQIRVTEAGNEQYGAFSVGKHDDIATAIGLSVLERFHYHTIPAAAVETFRPSWEHSILSSADEEAFQQRKRELEAQRAPIVDGFLNRFGFHR